MRLLLLALFLTNLTITSGQSLKGKIVDGKNNKPISWATLILHTKDGKRQIYQVDNGGNFSFQKIDTSGDIDITFSSIGYRDTIFRSIRIKGDSTVTLVYFNYCKYDVSVKNKICPSCKKKNSVIPIIYGLPIFRNGKDPTKDSGTKYILAGCEITGCDPHWYCKRDKTSF